MFEKLLDDAAGGNSVLVAWKSLELGASHKKIIRYRIALLNRRMKKLGPI